MGTPLWSTPLDTPLSLMLWPQLTTPQPRRLLLPPTLLLRSTLPSTQVSTAHISTTASVMLRPSPTHGAMASVVSTDTHMSTEVSTEDTPITMASVMLRPNPTHGAMASVASTDTQLSTEDTPTEDITMESAMLRPNPMLTCMAVTDTPMVVSTPMVSPMVDSSDKEELHSSGLNCNAFKQICLRKIIQLTYS